MAYVEICIVEIFFIQFFMNSYDKQIFALDFIRYFCANLSIMCIENDFP